MQIHPTAVIDPDAQLAADVTVGPYAVIEADVRLGEGVVVEAHAVIKSHTRIGARTRIHACAVLGDKPQDLAFADVVSYVEIGEGCTIREGVTVHRGTKEGTVTRIGNGCFLMANSHLAHNCVLGNDVILGNGVLLAGYAEVGDRAFFSGNSVVHQFTRVGRLAMMSGLSAISKDLPPFCVAQNLASNRVAALNVVGMRRAGFTPDERMEIKRAFSHLYRSGRNVTQSIEEMKVRFPEGPASELWRFAETSKRGICAGPNSALQMED